MNKPLVRSIDGFVLTDQNNIEKCKIDYISYKQSTIFHHHFSENNIDSSEKGFFLNKKYPAILTTVSSNYNILFPISQVKENVFSCYN